MGAVRVVVCFAAMLLASCALLNADAFAVKSKTLTVLGTLTESGGWSLQLNPVIMVEGRQITSLEVKSSDRHKLVSLEDKFVEARGKLTLITDGKTEEAPVFELWSIREHKSKGTPP